MARLFFIAPDGRENTQISVQSVGQGSTRQIASLIEAGDLPPGVVLPPGDFAGQMLYWDGAAWIPAPAGGIVVRTDGLTSVDPSSSTLNLNAVGAVLVGGTAQINDALGNAGLTASATGFQAAFADGVSPTVLVTGTAAGLVLSAASSIEINTLGIAARTLVGTRFLVECNGDDRIQADDTGIGFFAAAPVAQPTVTVTDAFAALNSLLAGLSALGLVAPAVVTQPAAVRLVGYTAAAPASMVLVAAGHAPGFYSCNFGNVSRGAGLGGTVNRALSFTAPTLGAANMSLGSINLTANGALGATTNAIYSTGATDIVQTLTPSLPSGAPILDLTAQAVFIGT